MRNKVIKIYPLFSNATRNWMIVKDKEKFHIFNTSKTDLLIDLKDKYPGNEVYLNNLPLKSI